MLHIELVVEHPTMSTLRVEGRLVGALADELQRQCQAIHDKGREVALDLYHVSYVDRRGARMLNRMLADGVKLVGSSQLLADFLDAAGVDLDPASPQPSS